MSSKEEPNKKAMCIKPGFLLQDNLVLFRDDYLLVLYEDTKEVWCLYNLTLNEFEFLRIGFLKERCTLISTL